MSRARVVVLAVVLAGAAAWTLAGFHSVSRSTNSLSSDSAPSHEAIDEASRDRLDQVLREAAEGS